MILKKVVNCVKLQSTVSYTHYRVSPNFMHSNLILWDNKKYDKYNFHRTAANEIDPNEKQSTVAASSKSSMVRQQQMTLPP